MSFTNVTPINSVETISLDKLSKKDFDRESFIDVINKKREILKNASLNLKAHFVGLDKVIDKIIGNIEVWFLMPDIIKRPIIINLWGMTGVGKTSAVRRLVRELNYSDSFVEIQLTNSGSSSDTYYSTIQSFLNCSNISPGKPGILLLDEMQRFRSVSDEGLEIHDYKFQDVWMLLSDGKFSGDANSKESIIRMIFESMYYEQQSDTEDEVTPPQSPGKAGKTTSGKKRSSPARARVSKQEKEIRKYHQSYYSAKSLKKLLKLREPVEEIMMWDTKKQNAILMEKLERDTSIYDGDDYSKLLIFVSGNLDEAYKMASECEVIDEDADVFHEHSLKINLVTIKRALKERFKPEQISRFGNVHIIYPSLSAKSYKTIITRRISEIAKDIFNKYGVYINVDKSMNDFIYRNGVFPTQGVRPLFSTVASSLENILPLAVLKAIEKNEKHIYVEYKNDHICSIVGDEIIRTKYEGDIDAIKVANTIDKKVFCAVHEAGHAIAYAILFGVAPTQIVSNTSSLDKSGFVGCHEFIVTKDILLKKIAITLSGRAAEERVFGEGCKSGGAAGDIMTATHDASSYVRYYAMSEINTRIKSDLQPDSETCNNDNEPTNKIIEEIIKKQKAVAEDLIDKHLLLLKEISDYLIINGTIEQDDFKNKCHKHGVEAKIFPTKEYLSDNYHKKYNEFFKDI